MSRSSYACLCVSRGQKQHLRLREPRSTRTAPCFVRMIQDQNVCSDVSQTSEVFRYSSHLLWGDFILRLKPSIGIEDYKWPKFPSNFDELFVSDFPRGILHHPAAPDPQKVAGDYRTGELTEYLQQHCREKNLGSIEIWTFFIERRNKMSIVSSENLRRSFSVSVKRCC